MKRIFVIAALCLMGTISANAQIIGANTDGGQITQLTYHPGNDLSPAWAPDGKSIYFLSQRGTESGEYNIWKMNFDL